MNKHLKILLFFLKHIPYGYLLKIDTCIFFRTKKSFLLPIYIVSYEILLKGNYLMSVKEY